MNTSTISPFSNFIFLFLGKYLSKYFLIKQEKSSVSAVDLYKKESYLKIWSKKVNFCKFSGFTLKERKESIYNLKISDWIFKSIILLHNNQIKSFENWKGIISLSKRLDLFSIKSIYIF